MFSVPPAISALSPPSSPLPQQQKMKVAASGSLTPELKFAAYKEQMVRSKEYLPPAIRDNEVTNGFIAMMTKVSASAQVEAAFSQGILSKEDRDAQARVIQKAPMPSKLSHRQLKSFADKFFDSQLQPQLANIDTTIKIKAVQVKSGGNGKNQINAFVTYFRAYYEGNFVSRLGQPISKPNISTTIPDSEIAAAETVLLEFLIDLVDKTPVLGDADLAKDAKTFYPGGTNKPTALTTDPLLAKYEKIQPSGSCGVNIDNYKYVVELANGASDRAATIGGLVANTPGGLSIGLGVLGKISIGDNQTLSTLAKTAASELAARATYAAAYATLEHVQL
jgi:hypothetical protein